MVEGVGGWFGDAGGLRSTWLEVHVYDGIGSWRRRWLAITLTLDHWRRGMLEARMVGGAIGWPVGGLGGRGAGDWRPGWFEEHVA